MECRVSLEFKAKFILPSYSGLKLPPLDEALKYVLEYSS